MPDDAAMEGESRLTELGPAPPAPSAVCSVRPGRREQPRFRYDALCAAASPALMRANRRQESYNASEYLARNIDGGNLLMTTSIRILLADDQLPWDDDAKDERVKAEIRRVFATAKPEIDVDKKFPEDKAWFTGLLKFLERAKGEKLTLARTFAEAETHIENYRDFDVAILDLSWWGDANLEGQRENRGLDLLLDKDHKKRSNIPIVCLSQNFKKDFHLVYTVCDRGAFPVQKDYTKLGHEMIYGAIRYLAKHRRSKVEIFVSHAHEDKKLAKLLVKAIELGLQVPSDAIRCTSVEEHRFPPGTNLVDALKDELAEASCVVGLWTSRSMKSQWCLFELGAAWGLARNTLFLSLGANALRDPPVGFPSIVSSELSDAVQLKHFLSQLARITERPIKDRDAAEAALERLAKDASEDLAKAANP
jgi:hypothetical protein